MPKSPNSKNKSRDAIKVTARGISTSVRSLRRRAEVFQAAIKHARRKKTEASEEELAIAVSNLVDERLDAETVLRHAQKTGLQVQALKDAIEYANNLLTSNEKEVNKSDPPTPKPKSKKVPKKVPEQKPDSETEDEGEEGEEEEEVPKTRSRAGKSPRSKPSQLATINEEHLIHSEGTEADAGAEVEAGAELLTQT